MYICRKCNNHKVFKINDLCHICLRPYLHDVDALEELMENREISFWQELRLAVLWICKKTNLN